MDFAALMAAELSKAKPNNKPSSSSTTTTTTKSEKYTKQAEVEAQRVAAYEAEQARLAATREEKARAKRQREEELAEEDRAREEKRRKLADEARVRREARDREEEKARRARLGLPELVEKTQEEEEEEEEKYESGEEEEERVDDEEAIRRLRELGQPARLFGESAGMRLRRLWKRTKAAAMASSAGAPIPTTLQLVPEKEMKVPSGAEVPVASDKAGRKLLYRQLVSYFSMVLVEYQRAMEAEGGKRDTIAARTAFSAMEQCRENMKPLFRKFEKGDLEDSLLKPIVEIVRAAQERRYVDANDGYLRLSIGKAAWPIGVTMVGIHERSAREKLHGGERGHVMGDEVTRKFLQSIKRCLTFAQVRWPPEDMRQLMG